MISIPQPLDAAQLHAVIRLLELRESDLALATRQLDVLAQARSLSAGQVKAIRMLLDLDDAEVDRALFNACADGESVELLLEHRAYVAHLHHLVGVDD